MHALRKWTMIYKLGLELGHKERARIWILRNVLIWIDMIRKHGVGNIPWDIRFKRLGTERNDIGFFCLLMQWATPLSFATPLLQPRVIHIKLHTLFSSKIRNGMLDKSTAKMMIDHKDEDNIPSSNLFHNRTIHSLRWRSHLEASPFCNYSKLDSPSFEPAIFQHCGKNWIKETPFGNQLFGKDGCNV